MKQLINILKYLLLFVIGIIIYYILNNDIEKFSVGSPFFSWIFDPITGLWSKYVFLVGHDMAEADDYGQRDYTPIPIGETYDDLNPETLNPLIVEHAPQEGGIILTTYEEGTEDEANVELTQQINDFNQNPENPQLPYPLRTSGECEPEIGSEILDVGQEWPWFIGPFKVITEDTGTDLERLPGCSWSLGYREISRIDSMTLYHCLQIMYDRFLRPLQLPPRIIRPCAPDPPIGETEETLNIIRGWGSIKDLVIRLIGPEGEGDQGNLFRLFDTDIWGIIANYILEHRVTIPLIRNLYVPMQTIWIRRILSILHREMQAITPCTADDAILGGRAAQRQRCQDSALGWTSAGGGLAPNYLEFRFTDIPYMITTVLYSFHLLLQQLFAHIEVPFDLISDYLYTFFARFLVKFIKNQPYARIDRAAAGPPIPGGGGATGFIAPGRDLDRRPGGQTEDITNQVTLEDYFNLVIGNMWNFQEYIILFLIIFIGRRNNIDGETDLEEVMKENDYLWKLREQLESPDRFTHGQGWPTLDLRFNIKFWGVEITITTIYRIIVLYKRLGLFELMRHRRQYSISSIHLLFVIFQSLFNFRGGTGLYQYHEDMSEDEYWAEQQQSLQSIVIRLEDKFGITITVEALKENIIGVHELFKNLMANLSVITSILMEFIQMSLLRLYKQ